MRVSTVGANGKLGRYVVRQVLLLALAALSACAPEADPPGVAASRLDP